MSTFYAARGGSCVLYTPSYVGKRQTLDPKHSKDLGGWYNPYMVRMQCNVEEYKTTNSPEALVNYLKNCVNYGGWFISIAHGVNEAKDNDVTEEQLRTIMAAMKRYQDENRLWVATYSEATTYIRERQNSVVEAYTTNEGFFVDLTMSEKTKEGLDLPAEIFNMPLTVKVELPTSWGKITYTQGGEEKSATAVKEGGVNFAYIDLVPNGGTATIVDVGNPNEYVEGLGLKQNVSADSSLTYNLYIPSNSEVAAVYLGKTAVQGTEAEGGYTKYSVGNINVTDIEREYTLTLKFKKSSGYTDYEFTHSVADYFIELLDSDVVTEKDKQLAYDFLTFAKQTVIKFCPDGKQPSTVKTDAALMKLQGFTASVSNESLADMDTVNNVLTGASLAINEKPYYVFYLTEGFTGKVSFTYSGKEPVEYEVINGYYHCKRYLILEIEHVYELTGAISITAEGVIGENTVSALGAYSMANYIDGLTKDGIPPEYESALYAYAISAKNYNS